MLTSGRKGDPKTRTGKGNARKNGYERVRANRGFAGDRQCDWGGQHGMSKQRPSVFRIFGPVLLFGAGMLWVAADKGHGSWTVAGLALGLGLLLAALAPRRKVVLGSLPGFGVLLILLLLEFKGGPGGVRPVADFWIPVALGGIVGALIGSRLKLRL